MVHILNDNCCEHSIFNLGRKRLITIIGFTDGYSDFYTNERTTQTLVLNNPSASALDSDRWRRYKYLRLFKLPFNIKFRFLSCDKIFKIRPTVWIRIKRLEK